MSKYMDIVTGLQKVFPSDADMVEVVRCKDCIYAIGKINKNNVICNRQDWATIWREDDYCSYGEQKEQENERLH